jgi:hypothetical protein
MENPGIAVTHTRKSAVLSTGLGICELRVVVYDAEISGMGRPRRGT